MVKKYSSLLLLTTSLIANDSFNIEDDFLKSLDNASEIATDNKLNIDKTTSLTTILQGKKLKKLGVNSVYDALKFIPGIELSKESSGVKSVIFRGSITKGEVKFMVDGIEVNNAYRASFYYFLDFPIELISRIEVLRGSGSVIHGSGAISGVINIITKSSQHSENGIFLSSGSHKYLKAGAYTSISEKDYQLSLDTYYQENDKVINSTDQRFEDYSFGLTFKVLDFEFNTRLKNSIYGNSHGVFNSKTTNMFAPDTYKDKDKDNNKNKTIFVNLKYTPKISQNNDLDIILDYSKYEQSINAMHYTGLELTSNFKEDTYSIKTDLTNTSIENNKLLIGANLKHTDSIKTDLTGYPGVSNIVSPNLEREIYSIYAKDNYLLTNKINLELGIRYDEYSDFGDKISPHMGFVYRLNDQSTLKLKYAEAFRAPSWIELYGLYGNDQLKAETSLCTELDYIYKHNANNRASLNIYHSKIEDYIYRYGTNDYSQDSELNLHGVELDYLYTPLHHIDINLLASYTDPKDKYNNTIPQITKFLTTASLVYTSDLGIIFGSTIRYKNTTDMDNEPILDQSISYTYKAFDIQLIAKNIFDSKVIYYDSNHDSSNPIEDAKREVFLNISWVY